MPLLLQACISSVCKLKLKRCEILHTQSRVGLINVFLALFNVVYQISLVSDKQELMDESVLQVLP